MTQRTILILMINLSHFLACCAIMLTQVTRRIREEIIMRVGANLERLTSGIWCLHKWGLTIVLNLGDWERALSNVETVSAAPIGPLRLWTVVCIGLFEEVAKPEQLLLIQLDLLIELVELGILYILFYLGKFFFLFRDFSLLLLNLFFKRHHQEGLSLISLGRLYYWSQSATILGTFLRILNELVLL